MAEILYQQHNKLHDSFIQKYLKERKAICQKEIANPEWYCLHIMLDFEIYPFQNTNPGFLQIWRWGPRRRRGRRPLRPEPWCRKPAPATPRLRAPAARRRILTAIEENCPELLPPFWPKWARRSRCFEMICRRLPFWELWRGTNQNFRTGPLRLLDTSLFVTIHPPYCIRITQIPFPCCRLFYLFLQKLPLCSNYFL